MRHIYFIKNLISFSLNFIMAALTIAPPMIALMYIMSVLSLGIMVPPIFIIGILSFKIYNRINKPKGI